MKSWRAVYGIVLTALIAGGFIAAVMNASSFSHETIQRFRTSLSYALLIQFAIVALFSVVERLFRAAGPRKPFKGYILNFEVELSKRLAGAVFGGIVGACVVAIGSRVGLGWVDLRFSTGHGIGVLILAFLLSTFIYDFFFYWFHRLQHESPFLWQEHKLHHMDEELCALFRESPLEVLLQGTATVIPMAILFKLDPLQGTIVAYGASAWVVFIHANIRLSLGPASVLFTGPQVHRIHHSRERSHYDKNYAAFFPIWDILFGTWHHPKRDEHPLTGVHGEREVGTLIDAVMLPFREWWKMFCAWRTDRVVSSR